MNSNRLPLFTRADNFVKDLTLTSNQLLLIVCAYIALILNLPFLFKSANAITGLDDFNWLFLITFPIFLFSITLLIQSLFAVKWLIKPILIITVIISTLMFYATLTYGIVFDYGMVQNTVESDSAELLSYLNLYAVVFFIVFAVIPAVLICSIKISYQPFLKELFNRITLFAGATLITVLIGTIFYSNYASVGRNNKDLIDYITPYKGIDSIYKFARKHYFYPPLKFQLLDTSPQIINKNNNKHVTVFVLGETARAQNFSLNGYNRLTNRYTANQDVISFTNISSCGTATAVSVPCMFSRLNKSNYDKRLATSQQNVIDIVHLAGTDVLWISNNNGSCKGVCTRVNTQQIATTKSNPLCDGEYCYDEALLQPLREKLHKLEYDNTLIVLHMIGSHGPTYFKRYPSNKILFTPDCQRSDIQNCTQEQLVNSYDNSIAYTDYVLNQIIIELSRLSETEDVASSMLYVSDHGESLGEKGMYLHGLPYAFAPQEQTHVPMIFWASAQVSNSTPDIDLTCLKNKSTNVFSHDMVFDAVLSITSVKSKTHHIKNDPFYGCKSASFVPLPLLESAKKIQTQSSGEH
ncbi:phosphoethanolamine transferase [Psychrosphaera saromensis]|uniref:Phosphoethanolamine transferase n=1 Tax=Psychrosphaera saromensis TaxID=716813 RepID=A0A2S7UV03_9GAMM|nr:phosphoethanolamine--lipid A transferase [Psychrosphaera saromensis]PQJ53579.1 phosphoethanolamine transferase [Psychrosphaera saromensis]GHB64129.1 phosphoethanolamine transferase [Psychrosphaera saromensis]GLQ15662.1 phosphoethanolamine transferase [Psychrosphaera saromensis]